MTPRLNGNLVTVVIAAERSQASSQGTGVFDVQTATTTVSGRLGEWLLLGGIDNSGEAQATGTLYSTRDYDVSALTRSIRVERVNSTPGGPVNPDAQSDDGAGGASSTIAGPQ